MPQLDLTWFLINFLIAWTLVIIVLSLLLNQEFEATLTDNQEEINPISNENSEQWLW